MENGSDSIREVLEDRFDQSVSAFGPAFVLSGIGYPYKYNLVLCKTLDVSVRYVLILHSGGRYFFRRSWNELDPDLIDLVRFLLSTGFQMCAASCEEK